MTRRDFQTLFMNTLAIRLLFMATLGGGAIAQNNPVHKTILLEDGTKVESLFHVVKPEELGKTPIIVQNKRVPANEYKKTNPDEIIIERRIWLLPKSPQAKKIDISHVVFATGSDRYESWEKGSRLWSATIFNDKLLILHGLSPQLFVFSNTPPVYEMLKLATGEGVFSRSAVSHEGFQLERKEK
jgi:hypothetical protein